MKRSAAFVVLLSLMLVADASYGFPRRTVAELDLMDDSELLEEARQVCVTSATNSYGDVDILLAATDYVQTIGRVARKHHGGTLPKPFSELAEATYGHVDPGAQYRTWDAKQCSKIVDEYIQHGKPRAKPKRKASKQ